MNKKVEKKKHEKMRQRKRRKMMKINKKKEEVSLHTQNPRRIPRFTVVVFVTLFVEILDNFHDFVSECVSFPKKINNQFWGLTIFLKKSDNFHWA